MSASLPSVSQDDDGPEEGEIEDDEDDIILLGGSPHRSSTTSTSLDIFPSPASKESYERDIRRHQLYRERSARIRRASSGSKSPYSMGSSIRGTDSHRTKHKHHRTGLTQGKENRHVHRGKSPVGSTRCLQGSSDRTLSNFREISPLRRDSSCSSVDSEDRLSLERSSHHRSGHKRPARISRTKRKSSSSPDRAFVPSKRRSHHSAKCPLIKVLHSVAKETRLIAKETSDSNPESSSLKQRLLNMGAMPAVSVGSELPSVSECVQNFNTFSLNNQSSSSIENGGTSGSLNEGKNLVKAFGNGSTQTDDLCEEVVVVKLEPEIVTLTDSEDGCSNGVITPKIVTPTSCCKDESNVLRHLVVASPSTSKEPPVNSPVTLAQTEAVAEEDEEDDIGHLRFLALQSKKQDQSPPDDADVLQLRLAALKTAFVKKFKTRKKIKIQLNYNKETTPLSPLEDIPLPFSPASPDEVITPVDMELAETDDDADSVHSMPECYSPSDPIESPEYEPSLEELLPPPPPPDLPIDLYYHEQNYGNIPFGVTLDNQMPGMNMYHPPTDDTLAPPPLPPYFRDLLSGMSDSSFFTSNPDSMSHMSAISDTDFTHSFDSPLQQHESFLSGSNQFDNAKGGKEENFELHTRVVNCNSNLLEVPITDCAGSTSPRASSEIEGNQDDPVKNPLMPLKNVPMEDSESDSFCEAPASEVKLDREKRHQRKPSLEEEEQLLRARLLLNIANKRSVSAQNPLPKTTPAPLKADSHKLPLKADPLNESKVKSDFKRTTSVLAKKTNEISKSSDIPVVQLKSSIAQPVSLLNQVSDIPRIVIDLNEDSDSSGDYKEAEALGVKCAQNRRNWMLHLKELEMNSPKIVSPGSKTKVVAAKNLPTRNSQVKKQVAKEKQNMKPFAENLADLESSVERFLKGVRTSHEAISKTTPGAKLGSTSFTPVAVRHLPASQQEEYRRLKQQIAKLERQRQMAVKPQRQNPSTILKESKPSGQNNFRTEINGLHQTSLQASKLSKVSTGPLKAVDVKTVSKVSISKSLEQPTSQIPPPVVSQKKDKSPIKVQQEASCENKSITSANISNKVFTKQSQGTKLKGNIPLGQRKLSAAQNSSVDVSHEVPQNLQGLLTLESNVIAGRSHVLNELSELSKLLSQVDKSLESQSDTATEVASLLDKLCLAAGRWRAQNRTVTGLVAQVAQQQKELSLRHKYAVAVGKSCALLGNKVHGKSYRVPIENADAMRFQLKQVHAKTQHLAKRRTTEQARKSSLEERAELCLKKLFLNVKSRGDSNYVKTGQSTSKQSSLNSPKRDESSCLHPQKRIPLESSIVQQAETTVGHKPSTLVSKDVNTSSEKLVSKILSSTIQDNSAFAARATSQRIAVGRVKSAKAKLHVANQKRSCDSKDIAHTQVLDKGKEIDMKNNLSDMDISTDGEEVDKKVKVSAIAGNADVTDMSISPDTSLSPSHVENGINDHPWSTAITVGISSMKPKPLENIHPSSAIPSGSKENFKIKTCGRSEFPHLSIVSKETNEESQPTIVKQISNVSMRSVLKDYVSPLGGLSLFRDSKTDEVHKCDLFAILCPYDLNGKCQDSECPYKHQHQ